MFGYIFRDGRESTQDALFGTLLYLVKTRKIIPSVTGITSSEMPGVFSSTDR